MPPILQLDLQQIVAQGLGFLLLLWVLKRFAWKPILAVLDARQARIESGLSKIEAEKTEIERLRLDYQARLAKIEDEARQKIQDAVREGQRVATEIQDEARNQAQAIIAKSQQTIELELAKAKVTLRDDLTEMTMEAVQDLLRQKLNPETDKALVNAILDELESSKPGS